MPKVRKLKENNELATLVAILFAIRSRINPLLQKALALLLILSLLITQLLITPIYAATSPWTQTDWVGGSGQTDWSDSTMYSSSSNVDDSTAGQVTLSNTANWYSTDWNYRKKITFDNSDQSENLSNFPTLVKLDSGTDVDYSKTEDNGEDIRFTDSNGTTLLKYEIEEWNESSSSYVWVKVPQVDGSSSTDNIYMYYGNSGASDAQDAENVWDSNYKLVQHLQETSSTHLDSTSNNNDSTTVSVTTQGSATGQVDGSDDFDGSNDYVQVDDANSLDITGNFTLEAWVNTGDNPNIKTSLLSKGSYGLKVEGNRPAFHLNDFTHLDQINDGGYARAVWGDGTYIYLANNTEGLRAYSFDGTTLTNVGSIDDGGIANGVWGDGTYIYLANDTDGLRAYTFNGTTFTNVGSIDDGGYARAVWGDGTYIYLANQNDGLRAYTFNGTTFTNVGQTASGNVSYGVWGDGTYTVRPWADRAPRAMPVGE